MHIVIHSSKAMRTDPQAGLRQPQLIAQAQELDRHLKDLPARQLAAMMKLSPALAEKTQALIADWHADPGAQTAAIDAFIGDIYSGMQAPTLDARERAYADEHLHILSGLYGALRPLDGITPYRLEMGYKLPGLAVKTLYAYWGERIAVLLPAAGPLVNLAAAEYFDAVGKYVDMERVIAPKFLTVSPKTGQPSFVVVHAKIARGAFARWLITRQVADAQGLQDFAEIGYRFRPELSTPAEPVFVCEEFGGTGLSIRMQDKD
ncbi:MAG: YaaA family protein [Anaerolineales bacterium]|nr:YaaA family protein [Anaerolineales bacterium]